MQNQTKNNTCFYHAQKYINTMKHTQKAHTHKTTHSIHKKHKPTYTVRNINTQMQTHTHICWYIDTETQTHMQTYTQAHMQTNTQAFTHTMKITHKLKKYSYT